MQVALEQGEREPQANRNVGLGMRLRYCLGIWIGIVVGMMVVADRAHAASDVYTVGRYPIEAVADNAVQAKAEAMADGHIGAFRSLLKRLVPVTSYRYLPKPKPSEIQGMIAGLNIRSEQNSSTEYLAEIDFRYSPRLVRRYLQKARLPFLDRQAPEVLLVPVYRNANTAAPRYLATATGQRAWRKAWADQDLNNTLTPLKLAQYKLEIRDDVRSRLMDGDMSVLRIFQQEYGAERVLVAQAIPDATGQKIIVTMAGQDAVGPFHLKRTYPIEDQDLLYSSELATIIGLGVIEGRWKAAAPRATSAGLTTSGPVQDVHFFVRFNGLGHWQQIRERLANLPGVDGFNTGTVSARGAEVALRYPGGLTNLRRRIASEGFLFSQSNGSWVLSQN